MSGSLPTALAAVVGGAIGSFLNVCIHRLPRDVSVVWPASACPSCGSALAWFENVPVLSFVALRGRCRRCKTRISARYPVVEAVTAVMCAAAWWYWGPTPLFLSRVVLGCALIVLFAIDLEHHLLPNAVTLPGIVVGLAFSFFTEPGWLDSVLGIAIGGGVLYAIGETYYRVRHEEGLGMGDVKMLAMIGAFTGWKLAIVTLAMSSIAGSIVGVALIATRRGDMKYALPFGTFLAIGAAVAAVAGGPLLDWYLEFWTP